MSLTQDNAPRVLVFSNNSFSKSNSNGRTLGNLFAGWPRERLAQFTIMCIDPDFEVCDNYYQVKDADAVRALVKGEKAVTGRVTQPTSATSGSQRFSRAGGKTALKMLLRNAVWNIGRWRGKRFRRWVDDFAPEVIVVQSGDSAFMLSLAASEARKRHIPLVIYNTEGYLFFDHNFMRPHWTDCVAHPLFKWHYRRVFRRALAASAHSVYLNGKLRDDYEAFMQHPATVIYNSSDLAFEPKAEIGKPPRISYLGNLGIKRPEALAGVGQVLNSISPELHIDVYGNASAADEALLREAVGVEYHGSVPYEQVIEIIRQSDILFHIEKNDSVLVRELRYAFSTKIADSICSGTNFVVYAPANLACSQYVAETGAAWLASTPEQLRATVNRLLNNPAERRHVTEKAREAAHNHNLKTNATRFQSILNHLTLKYKSE